MIVGTNPLAAEDVAVLFPDGWIAVARLSPFRLGWIEPNGQGRTVSLQADRIPVSTEMRCAEARRTLGKVWTCSGQELPGWPAFVPPFLATSNENAFSALVPLPEGSVLLRRTCLASAVDCLYMVISRDGHVSQFALPATDRLLSVGRAGAYVVRTDSGRR
jgi:hypothetical protein